MLHLSIYSQNGMVAFQKNYQINLPTFSALGQGLVYRFSILVWLPSLCFRYMKEKLYGLAIER